ncbi:unnamed protein product [Camellia sinensis]
MEIYVEKQLQQSPTDPEDVDAMVNISSTYGVKKNWQGDPCFPMNLSWNLSSSGLTGVIAPALSSLKSVLHLNLANNNLTSSVPKALLKKSSLILSVSCKLTMTKKNQLTVAIVASFVSSISFFSTIAIWWRLKTRRHKAGRTLKGGFGIVHLGYLEDGTEVAVKTLYRSSTQASEQFWTEAELLTTIHHRNLAPLIGYCDEGANTALIYEYMANGNLQECLLAQKQSCLNLGTETSNSNRCTTWLQTTHNPQRHQDCQHLVNENLQAKVVDFGLSKNFPDEDGDHVSTAVVGTLGYLDPKQVSSQYHSTSRLTKKSDVYSFGVVLLELITGKPTIIKNDENIHVVNWVKPMLEKGEISNIVDPRLQGEFDINSAWKALETAMACIPTSFNQRPNMSGVVGELKDYLKIYVGSGKTLDTIEINKLTSSQRNLKSSMICPQAR